MDTFSSDLPKVEEFLELGSQSLLEIGCGDGRLTALLTGKAGTVTAIDPDAASIGAAAENVSGATFTVGSGENLGFADNAFDIILFSYSLHHQDCARALAEAKRVVRQNGRILVIEPAHDSEYTRLVSVFEIDEVSRLRTTLAHIQSGPYRILSRDCYSIEYWFADEFALYTHFKEKQLTSDDNRATAKMQKIVGSKRPDKPLVILDTVNILLIDPR